MNAVVVIPTPTQPTETDPVTAAVLSAVLGAVPHGIAVTGLDGRLAHANDALAQRLGYPAPELDALTLAHLLHPDDVDGRLTGDFARRVAVLRWRHADGHYRPARTTVAPVHHHETGVTHQFVYTVEDVPPAAEADRRRREAALAAATAAFAKADRDPSVVQAEICRRAMQLTGAAGAVIELEDGPDMVFAATVGAAAELRGTRVPAVGSLSGLCVQQVAALICEDAFSDPRVNTLSCRRRGMRSMVVAPLRHGDQIAGVLKVYSPRPHAFDAEDLAVLELLAAPFGSAMAHAATLEASFVQDATDAMTGLGNRQQALYDLERALARRGRQDGELAVLFLDLDGFKAINDSHGHALGDAVLREVGERIRSTIRDCDRAVRYGGDEFLVIAERFGDPADVRQLADRLIAAVSAPYLVGDRVPATLGLSVGIAVARQGMSPQEVIAAADAAMYEAKRQGRGRQAWVELRQEA